MGFDPQLSRAGRATRLRLCYETEGACLLHQALPGHMGLKLPDGSWGDPLPGISFADMLLDLTRGYVRPGAADECHAFVTCVALLKLQPSITVLLHRSATLYQLRLV